MRSISENRVYGLYGLFLLLLIFLTACKHDADEQPIEIRDFPGVNEALWPYFIKFEDEARSRGIDVDLKAAGIKGEIEHITEEGIAGTCHFNFREPNNLTIDEEFWNFADDLFREFIIFHELGHCFLFRDHREDEFTNRTCMSIMRSGGGGCRDNYTLSTRMSYLDELFDNEFRNDILED